MQKISIDKDYQCAANHKGGGIKAYWFIKMSDIVIKADGEMRLKRKYGKFKREVIKIDAKDILK